MIITWTDADGASQVFDNNIATVYRIDKIDGLESPDGQLIQQQAPFQHGATVLRAQLAPRVISFEILFESVTASDAETRRRDLGKIFSPTAKTRLKNQGTLTFLMAYGTTYTITATPHGIKHPPSTAPLIYRSQVQFLCDDPYFSTSVEQEILAPNIVEVISNGGHVTTGPIIFVQGPCTSPRITNLSSLKPDLSARFIEATDYSVLTGHRMEFDLRPIVGKSVYDLNESTQVRTSAMEFVPNDADFWELLAGNNNLLFETSDDLGTCTVTWQEKFQAIG